MSGLGLFIVGALVTLIVAIALALLVYAAILDGRYAAAQRAAFEKPQDAQPELSLDRDEQGPFPARLAGAELGPAVAMTAAEGTRDPMVT